LFIFNKISQTDSDV